MHALGGFLPGGAMNDMLIDMTTEIITMRDGAKLFDVTLLTVPIAGIPQVPVAVVAQVYPGDPSNSATGMEDGNFSQLIDAITNSKS